MIAGTLLFDSGPPRGLVTVIFRSAARNIFFKNGGPGAHRLALECNWRCAVQKTGQIVYI